MSAWDSCWAAPAGNDILYDDALCEQGRNFNNKIWNAFRLVKGWNVDETLPQPQTAAIAVEWFDAQLNRTLEEVKDLFGKYRLSEALMAIYKLFWDEFSSWYLEMVKPAYQQPIDRKTYDATLRYFDAQLRMLHPFMPFITEELWQHLYDRKEGRKHHDSTHARAPTGRHGNHKPIRNDQTGRSGNTYESACKKA